MKISVCVRRQTGRRHNLAIQIQNIPLIASYNTLNEAIKEKAEDQVLCSVMKLPYLVSVLCARQICAYVTHRMGWGYFGAVSVMCFGVSVLHLNCRFSQTSCRSSQMDANRALNTPSLISLCIYTTYFCPSLACLCFFPFEEH